MPLLPLALVGAAVGILLVVTTIRRLVSIAHQPELARAALGPEQAITFAQAGPVELAIEGPFLTGRFRGLAFELADAAGEVLAPRRIWFRTQRGGFSRVQLSIQRFEVTRPGAHRLRVTGLRPGTDYGGCAVVFVRPSGPGIAATIVALLASIGLTAACVAIAGVLLAPPDTGSPSPTTTSTLPPALAAHGGRPLRVGPDAIGTALEVAWPTVGMRVRVPADWEIRQIAQFEVDLRDPTSPSTYLVAHATPLPAGPDPSEYLRAHVRHVQEQLAARQIDGYATQTLGALPGVMTIARRYDGTGMITWTGFSPTATGAVSVTIALGADAPDFERDEPLLGAILDSVRFD